MINKGLYTICSSTKIISCEINNIKLEKKMIKKINFKNKHIKSYIISPIIQIQKLKKKLKSKNFLGTKKENIQDSLLTIEFNKNIDYHNCVIKFIRIP